MLIGKLKEFNSIADKLTANSYQNFNKQWDLNFEYKPIPHTTSITLSFITYFTLKLEDDNKELMFHKSFQAKNYIYYMKFPKFNRIHRVSISNTGKMNCDFCDFSKAVGLPCRHMIAVNKNMITIHNFHI